MYVTLRCYVFRRRIFTYQYNITNLQYKFVGRFIGGFERRLKYLLKFEEFVFIIQTRDLITAV